MALIDIDWRPDRKKLREFGFVGAGACLLLVGQLLWKQKLLFWGIAADNVSSVAIGLGLGSLLFLLLAFAFPPILRPIYLVLTIVTLPIGFVISHVVMALIFYLVFGALGIFFRVIRRDSLRRAYDPDAKSYWIPRTPIENPERYFRQF
ncbi:MAG: hypothetical protein OEV00_06435 [Acidobacteriota bacterium]|nr:hypothetical protein [Acidobacteriota bacterium]MDH3784948.1 hypothetical protein [Acidobacteriota bacterium]